MATTSDRPVFQQIAEALRQDIAAGVHRPGEAVPSIRAMATAMRINPNTIKRACDALQAEGILEARPGLGLFVTETGTSRANAQTVETVRSTFEGGVRAAVAARLPRSEVDVAYGRAWEVVAQEKQS
jgi:GntR family transcriptional regulator